VKDVETKEIITIDYFACNESKDSENCNKFNDMFSTSSEQKFVDAAGITYYKQTEVQSWFFSN
jgi:hypothetical protein